MNTFLLNSNKENLTSGAQLIKNGGTVAFPTETVYGLGCDIFNENAATLIYKIKGRSFNKPLSAHISSIEQVDFLSDNLSDSFFELVDFFLQGALTIIVRANTMIPNIVTAGTQTIAVRFPANKICQEFINECGRPLAATSANISGGISPINADQVLLQLEKKIDAIIDGGECQYKAESTVISLVGKPTLIRAGVIEVERIEEVMKIRLAKYIE